MKIGHKDTHFTVLKESEKLELIENQCLDWLNENGYEIKRHEFKIRSIELELEDLHFSLWIDIDIVKDFLRIIDNQTLWHMAKIVARNPTRYSNTDITGHLPVLLKKYYKHKTLC